MKWLILWIISLVGLIGTGVVGLLNFWTFLGGIVWLVVATFLVIWFWLAPTNRYFTFVKEGTAKIVVRGDRFEKALIQWEGHTFNYQVTGDNRWNVIEGEESWHPFGGLRFYGFWPIWDIYIYRFQWIGVTIDDKVEIHPEEWLDFVLLKDDVYWCKVEKAEDKNLFPLDVELLITIRVVNPYKALFRVQNWNEMVMNRAKPLFREYVANTTFDDLIRHKQEIGGEIYKKLKDSRLLDEFREVYGIEIKDGGIEIKEVNPIEVPGVRSLREITLLKQIAKREREKILIEADAEAKKRKRVAEGEARRLEIEWGKIREFGDLGRLVRTLEALEKSPEKGAKWIIPIPEGAELLRGVFGGRTPKTVSPQEFRGLKEKIEQLLKEKDKEKGR